MITETLITETWQLRAQFADDGDGTAYRRVWPAARIGHHIHDPHDLYQKAASS
ncbi:hypothetical protein [Mycolicibacterium aurum]|uniref:hypothetical protein n=1 Tax=Mycolicibacterium aurum TaxID=1791 RepID=UPI000A8F05D3|nr:hypothetical protein [Mycolicibacterium aurum]